MEIANLIMVLMVVKVMWNGDESKIMENEVNDRGSCGVEGDAEWR